jgi:hypothetical protein
MKIIIISVLIILALLLLFYNIINLNDVNVTKENGNKVVLTRFSDNNINYKLKDNNYSFEFTATVNSLGERTLIVETKNWYLDIVDNKLRLVNNTNNDVLNFNKNLEVGTPYRIEVTKKNKEVKVVIDGEPKVLKLNDEVYDNNINFGSSNFNGKIDLLNQVIENFNGDIVNEQTVFVGSDFVEPMITEQRFLNNLKDTDDNIVSGILFYIVKDSMLKMYATRDNANKSLIDIREIRLKKDEDVSKFTDEDFINKFNEAENKQITSARFRVELYIPPVTTTSTTTFAKNSLKGCFLPEANFTSKTDCISKCLGSNNKNCNSLRCQQLCLDCVDVENCPWITNDAVEESTIPDAPEIRLIADDRKIIVDWKKPYDGGSQITNYIVIVYEAFNKNNGIIVSEVNSPECLNCEHTITGLQNQKMYDVGVRAVNSRGLGYLSKIETIAPDGPLEGSQISNTLLPTDNEILRDIKKEMNEFVCKQDEYYSLKDFIKNL